MNQEEKSAVFFFFPKKLAKTRYKGNKCWSLLFKWPYDILYIEGDLIAAFLNSLLDNPENKPVLQM